MRKLPSMRILSNKRLRGLTANELLLSSLIMMFTIILLLNVYGYSYSSILSNLSSIKETSSLQEFVYEFNKNINSSTDISLFDSSRLEAKLEFANKSYVYEFVQENGFVYASVNGIKLFKVLAGEFRLNGNLVSVNMALENSDSITLYSSKRKDGD